MQKRREIKKQQSKIKDTKHYSRNNTKAIYPLISFNVLCEDIPSHLQSLPKNYKSYVA